MQLGYVILYVTDVAEAASFYERAFGLTLRFAHESGMYAELASGSTTLAFAHNDMLAMNTGLTAQAGEKNGFEIALTTDDVGAAFSKAVQAGARKVAEPKDKPWGQTVAYVRDPFGTLVEICTPMG